MSWMDTLKYYIYIIIHIGVYIYHTWKRDYKRFINLYHDKIRIF